jgi:hypothetical protein
VIINGSKESHNPDTVRIVAENGGIKKKKEKTNET